MFYIFFDTSFCRGGEAPKSALIDLMDDDANHATDTQAAPVGAVNELADIFGSSSTTQQGPLQQQQQQAKASNADILSMFGNVQQPQPRPVAPGYSSYPSASSGPMGQWPGAQGYQAQMGGQIMLPGTPQNQMKGMPNVATTGSRTGTPSLGANPGLNAMAPTPAAPAPAPAPAQKDPFADLAGLF